MGSKRKLLYDGDLICYRSAAAMEQETDWGDGVKTFTTDVRACKKLITQTIKGIAEDLGGGEIVVCFSDDEYNYRKFWMPEYKSNRKDTRKPMGWDDIVNWRNSDKFPFRTFWRPTLEADDCIGIGMTQPGSNCIGISDDKDFLSIPGKFYRMGHGQRGPEKFNQSEWDADIFFLKQVLTGDTVDGYKGCPGVGPVGADKVIEDALRVRRDKDQEYTASKLIWPHIVRKYKSKGLSEEDALLNARMARILRWDDYDHKAKEPIKWIP